MVFFDPVSPQSEADTSVAEGVSEPPGALQNREASVRELIVVVILIAISSLTLLPFWIEANDRIFATIPELHSVPVALHQGLRWFAVAVDAAPGLILGALGLRLSARIGLVPFRVLSGRTWGDLRPQIRPLVRRWIWLGSALFLITIAVTVPQFLLFGLAPPPGTSSRSVSQHQAVIGVMTQMLSARAAPAFAIGAPILEEVEFRLFLLALVAWLCVRMRTWNGKDLPRFALATAIIVSGFAFGLGHVVSSQSVAWWRPWYLQILTDPRGYLGMVLGYVYWRWGLESTIGAHAVWNILVIAAAKLATVVI